MDRIKMERTFKKIKGWGCWISIMTRLMCKSSSRIRRMIEVKVKRKLMF